MTSVVLPPKLRSSEDAICLTWLCNYVGKRHVYPWPIPRMNLLSTIRCRCQYFALTVQHRSYSSSTFVPPLPCLIRHVKGRHHHVGTSHQFPRRRDFFSSNAVLQQTQRELESPEGPQATKRKITRSPAAKNSLRRVAVEAQRSRDGVSTEEMSGLDSRSNTKVVWVDCCELEWG